MQGSKSPIEDGINGGYDREIEVTIQSVRPGSQNQSAAVCKVEIRAIRFGG